jgi:hypothetical protein
MPEVASLHSRIFLILPISMGSRSVCNPGNTRPTVGLITQSTVLFKLLNTKELSITSYKYTVFVNTQRSANYKAGIILTLIVDHHLPRTRRSLLDTSEPVSSVTRLADASVGKLLQRSFGRSLSQYYWSTPV